MTYRSKLLVNFVALFAVFTVVLVMFQYSRERQYKRDLLESRLESYADAIAAEALTLQQLQDTLHLYTMTKILPSELRLTVLDRRGNVLYESLNHKVSDMENHSDRPEIQAALTQKSGSDIRFSETDSHEYFYYAKSFYAYIVRVALPYDASLQSLMKADSMFLWFVLLLFTLALVILIQISDRLGKAVTGLKSFMRSADRGLVDYEHIKFPSTELGDISRSIMLKYKQLEETNKQAATERERLMRHFHYFEEGIAIFTPDKKCTYANPRFMQYVNVILDHPTADINAIWQSQDFVLASEFLNINGGSRSQNEEAPIFRFNIKSGGSTFSIQLLIYSDGSFELTLADITRAEKNKILKQQMSNNITHELRTPVSSIRGYIETILSCPNLSEERKNYFIDKAYAQTIRLTDLIRDVALITKTEEAADLMPREEIKLLQIITEIREDLLDRFTATQMKLYVSLPEDTTINGNYSLIYSIFRNLTENSLRYAGNGTEVHINCYNITPEFLYFTVYDNGCGVPEEHLPRLFERFYRVSEGRTRDNGGTGLGLSIVRNAVLFHQGDISVRNRKEGGLEFLFSLHR